MYKFIILFLLVGCLSACGTRSTDDTVRQFIPGKYVRKIENEFSVANDTLYISVLSKQGNSYRIEKRTSFHRLAQSARVAPSAKSESWTAVYNESEKVLRETVKGKVLAFLPERNAMLLGTSEYQKIEN
jgi:hypothetical protein